MNTSQMKQRRIRLFRKIARVWSILLLTFAIALLFSLLLDQSGESPTLWYWLLFGLWIVAVFGVMAGWRWELAGGIVAIVALVSREMVYYFLSAQFLVNFWMVWLPVLPPAMLFILIWRLERQIKEAQLPRDVYD